MPTNFKLCHINRMQPRLMKKKGSTKIGMSDKRGTQCCALVAENIRRVDLGVIAKAVVMKNLYLKSSIFGLFTRKLRHF